jgi:hypothetical protein
MATGILGLLLGSSEDSGLPEKSRTDRFKQPPRSTRQIAEFALRCGGLTAFLRTDIVGTTRRACVIAKSPRMSQTNPAEGSSGESPPFAPVPPNAVAKSKARRKRLPLLVGVLVCIGGAAGYFSWRSVRDQRQVEQVRAKLADSGIQVLFSYAQPDESGFALFRSMEPTKIVLVRAGSRRLTDADLKELVGINQDLKLMLSYSEVTDNGIESLAGKSNVRWLDLGRTRITDAGVKYLRGMNLESLDLSGTHITDTALATLGELDMPRLKELIIEGTGVTDAGLTHLEHFKTLEFVVLGQTKVTASGLRHLRDQIPGIEFPGGI